MSPSSSEMANVSPAIVVIVPGPASTRGSSVPADDGARRRTLLVSVRATFDDLLPGERPVLVSAGPVAGTTGPASHQATDHALVRTRHGLAREAVGDVA